MKGHRIPYSAAEMAWLEANRLLVISEYHKLFSETFQRFDVSPINLHSLRKRKGWSTGRTGCFVKGMEPHNKGKPHVGAQHPNSVRTRFAKGGRTGKAALLYKPIGTERISAYGYLERKVHDGMPLQSRWQLVHRIEWEAVNGPVPEGMALKCKGDRLNTSPDNWELIPRALLPRLNGGRHKTRLAYDDAAPEVKPAILAVAKLEHSIREKRRAA